MDPIRVLIVDDEEGMRTAVSRALDRARLTLPDIDGEIRYRPETASTAEEALQRIEAAAPDVLLLDHKLPGMSGLDLLQEIEGRGIMTIMVTAYASLETAVAATKRGAFDFLAKPFTPEELKGTVRKATHHLLLQRQARDLAEEKRKIRFQAISVLVHELKAPLAAIEGYLYVMKNRYGGDSIQSYDKAIERSLVRVEGMRKLILDVLDLTRIESGQKKREITEIDVMEIVRAAIDTVTPDANARGITVRLDAPGSILMHADRSEIEIVMNNLLTNAVKYNKENGSVHATLESRDGWLIIRVADTGIGLTPEDAAKLFNEFVRIKNDQTRNILGSGLGLSIVKKLATLYGGDVSVESEPGAGSTFGVRLAMSQAAAASVAEAPTAAGRS